MSILNQFSFLWLVLILFIFAAFRLARRKPQWKEALILGLVIAALFAAWIILRPSSSLSSEGDYQVQARIGQGTPVLLELFSPF